ncbi:MAG: FAD:protein FMN transferase [Actinomycetota bacterium]|nr:FAD:protein FMN transferase [Actinomycetota bacterium]MDH5313368.1 FAD:protein FMN transferase [Actinomycetota bacterium]
MGTTLTVYGPAERFEEGQRVVENIFGREEQRFSRFRHDSELSRVNDRAGRWTVVSVRFRTLLRLSLDRAAQTNGAFDPTVLRAVEAAGYDRDFDDVIRAARGRLRPPVPCGRWAEIELTDRELRLPPGVGLDLGGIAKGWTVDLAVAGALSAGMPWVLVSAGGDLRVGGRAPRLPVDVEDPHDPDAPLVVLSIDRGALATSSTARRSWGTGLHHVIDPRRGAPSRSDAEQVTTWAPTCAEAEVRATVALLLGTRAAASAPSVIVGTDGVVHNSFAPEAGSSPDEEAA